MLIFINSNRRQLKAKAKQTLNPHFKFFVAMILPWIIVSYLSSINEKVVIAHLGLFSVSVLAKDDLVSLLINIISYLLVISFGFACLNLIRGKSDFNGGIAKSATIFHNGHYFIGAIMIGILQIIWEILWSLLLLFPGYIKQLAYSQATLIYKDAVDAGKPIKYRDAITKSRHLMRGHKWELFVIQLSFIGWWIISICTLGLADFWIRPYYQLTLVNFYQNLLKESSK